MKAPGVSVQEVDVDEVIPTGPHPSIFTMRAIRNISIEPQFGLKKALSDTASVQGLKFGAMAINNKNS